MQRNQAIYAPTLPSLLTLILYTTIHPTPPSPPIDIGTDDYLWRVKDQWLGARFTTCYKGPEWYALGPAERRRRLELYRKRREDEFWYLVRAYGREVRWWVWGY